MDYKFTADMEDKLDDVAGGKIKHTNVLSEFYEDFHPIVEGLYKSKPVIEDKYTRVLGNDPETGQQIVATIGKYTPLVKKIISASKSLKAPIKEPLTLENITLEDALKLFEYPKVLGKYKNREITLNRGKYGLYIKYGTDSFSVQNEDIKMEEIKEMIDKRAPLAQLKSDTKTYIVLTGPYGRYIKISDSKTKKSFNVALPEDVDVSNLTVEKIQEIVDNYFKYKRSRSFKKKETDNTTKESGIKPVAKPVAKPATKPKPVAKPVAKPATKPKPVAKPVTKPATKPKPVAKPVAKPTANSKKNIKIVP